MNQILPQKPFITSILTSHWLHLVIQSLTPHHHTSTPRPHLSLLLTYHRVTSHLTLFKMSNQPVHIISDTESESESDGGMQLDDLDRADGIPMFDTSENGGLPNVDGILMPRPQSEDDGWGLNTSNGSDTGIYPSSLPHYQVQRRTIHHLSLSPKPRESLLLCITTIHGTNPTSTPTPPNTTTSLRN